MAAGVEHGRGAVVDDGSRQCSLAYSQNYPQSESHLTSNTAVQNKSDTFELDDKMSQTHGQSFQQGFFI